MARNDNHYYYQYQVVFQVKEFLIRPGVWGVSGGTTPSGCACHPSGGGELTIPPFGHPSGECVGRPTGGWELTIPTLGHPPGGEECVERPTERGGFTIPPFGQFSREGNIVVRLLLDR